MGHAGDGNLHPVIITPQRRPRRGGRRRGGLRRHHLALALELGGAITGEHGVGSLKAPWLAEEVGEANLSVQRAVKAALDPAGILNPGDRAGWIAGCRSTYVERHDARGRGRGPRRRPTARPARSTGSRCRCREGRVLGVLGPNGAGKSTTVRMLSTMTRADAGTARIAGLDVVTQARPRCAA